VASVYVETSFVSACVSDRADATSIHRRGISLEWWTTQAAGHNLFTSAEVLGELNHPSFPHRQTALIFVQKVPLLSITEDVQGLATLLVREKVMPGPVAGDAIHVAVAAI
jgi:hypothetical protein